MKRSLWVFPLVVLMAFTLGCQDQKALAELGEMKVQAEVEEQNIDLVKRFIEELNSQNGEIYMEICGPDYRWYFPSNSPDPLSREEEMEFVKGIWESFPDITWIIEDIFASDNRVFAQLTTRGTHEGEFMGIAATGKPIAVSLVLAFRIEDGKLVESREEADMLRMMQQLGMELKPAAGG